MAFGLGDPFRNSSKTARSVLEIHRAWWADHDDGPPLQPGQQTAVVPQEPLKALRSGLGGQVDEVHGLGIAGQEQRQLVDEVARRKLLTWLDGHVDPTGQVGEVDVEPLATQRHLVLLGRGPFIGRLRQDEVEQHQLAGDEGGRRGAAIPVVVLAQGSIHRACTQVIDVPAVDLPLEPASQATRHDLIEEVTDVLPVLNPGEGRELSAEAEAAVERHRDQEPGLPRRKPEVHRGPARVHRRSCPTLQMMGIVRRATGPGRSASRTSATGRPVHRESRLRLAGDLAPGVVLRDEFQIAVLQTSLGCLVFDAKVGDLEVALDHGQARGGGKRLQVVLGFWVVRARRTMQERLVVGL